MLPTDAFRNVKAKTEFAGGIGRLRTEYFPYPVIVEESDYFIGGESLTFNGHQCADIARPGIQADFSLRDGKGGERQSGKLIFNPDGMPARFSLVGNIETEGESTGPRNRQRAADHLHTIKVHINTVTFVRVKILAGYRHCCPGGTVFRGEGDQRRRQYRRADKHYQQQW